jgi:hypothetical protein
MMTADLAHTSSLHRYRAAGPRSSPGGDTRVCPDAAARRTVESYGGGPRSCHSRVFGCGRNELANQQSATPAPRTGLHEGVARPGLGRSQQQRTSACSAAVGGRWARASWTDRPSSLPASGHATSATPARPTCALLGALSRRKDALRRRSDRGCPRWLDALLFGLRALGVAGAGWGSRSGQRLQHVLHRGAMRLTIARNGAPL